VLQNAATVNLSEAIGASPRPCSGPLLTCSPPPCASQVHHSSCTPVSQQSVKQKTKNVVPPPLSPKYSPLLQGTYGTHATVTCSRHSVHRADAGSGARGLHRSAFLWVQPPGPVPPSVAVAGCRWHRADAGSGARGLHRSAFLWVQPPGPVPPSVAVAGCRGRRARPLAVVPGVSIAVRFFGSKLRQLSKETQAASAAASACARGTVSRHCSTPSLGRSAGWPTRWLMLSSAHLSARWVPPLHSSFPLCAVVSTAGGLEFRAHGACVWPGAREAARYGRAWARAWILESRQAGMSVTPPMPPCLCTCSLRLPGSPCWIAPENPNPCRGLGFIAACCTSLESVPQSAWGMPSSRLALLLSWPCCTKLESMLSQA